MANQGGNALPPGTRVAQVSFEIATQLGAAGMPAGIHARLSALNCWDAAMYCASLVGGVVLPANAGNFATAPMFGILQNLTFGRLFPNIGPARTVTSEDQLRGLPLGCFIGFVRNGNPPYLRHVMLHAGLGRGCGSHNDCIFTPSRGVWEELDMGRFFTTDANLNTNQNTHMIYAPATGQAI